MTTTTVYRCPATGLNVQGWFEEKPAAEGENVYQAVTCLMCRQTHLVNPANGKVLSGGPE